MFDARQILARSATFTALVVVSFAAQAQQPTFDQQMNLAAQPLLDHRVQAIQQIHTEAQAIARQKLVRTTILQLMGGLPENSGPLNAMIVGSIPQDGFRIERIIYDSLPGYHVTANLYLPSGNGPFPVVIYHAGHGPFGKTEAFGLASNLARNGIAVLAYDPLGAGERLQAIDPSTGKSFAGGDEHSQAELPISLVGDHVSRYMLWDAMRGIDYLATRSDIDSNHIGSYGCSGGGTMSAYLTALDPRVKAGAVACYITTYDELLKAIGPQDGEQVIPNFIQQGLDLPDYIELVAPRPYAIISTTEDMFPFAGAKAAHEEAQHFYSLLNATDNLKFFTGPGRHGAIRPLMPDIVAFFLHALKGSDAKQEMATLKPPAPQDLRCTTTGQVTTALIGRTIFQINQERAKEILLRKPAISTRADLTRLQASLRTSIPAVAGISTITPLAAQITTIKTEQRSGYELRTITFHSRSGLLLPGLLAVPSSKKLVPALFISPSQPIETLSAEGSQLDREAKAGKLVLAVTPLPWPTAPNEVKPTFGNLLPWASRAFLVGKNFVGLRTEDMLSAVVWLASQTNVNKNQIAAYAEGTSGVALLHAAALDPRIQQITVQGTLISYHSIIDAAVHRNTTEAIVPNVLLHYDLDDLITAIAPRRVTIIDPVDGENKPVSKEAFQQQMSRVLSSDETLKTTSRVKFASQQAN